MNFLISAAWLFKKKPDPEPMKEGEVIEIVQQALENPSANTTVTTKPLSSKEFSNGPSGQYIQPAESPASATHNFNHDIENQQTEQDPKVVEYFKDFPEPYREKAINRFSKREGLHRFDFIRDHYMKHEWSTAMNRAVFLEDRREEMERDEQKRNEQYEAARKEYIEQRKSGNIPQWESRVLEYIPVYEDESTGWKLFNVVNIAAAGCILMYHGVKLRHKIPKNGERWKIYKDMTIRFTGAGVFGTGAVCRLMNWGPFDRSTDGRDIFTRMMEDSKEDFKNLIDYVEEKTRSK